MAMEEEEEEADWDLLAVVRGFTSTVSAAPEVIQQHPAPPADHGGLIEQPLTSRTDLRDEEPQLVFGTRPHASVITLTSRLLQSVPTATSSSSSAPQTHQRSKKRKSLQKRVCHVPVEGLSSDMWAWRKYGQKPIKGSPYPRGYYKCSSSKGCPARKQVERNKSEPEMLIVTYTSEHNHPVPTHRNSLAGSTRQKPTNVDKADSPQSEMELKEMLMNNDDFFVGFQHLNHDSDSGEFGGAIDSSITLPPPPQL